MLYDLKEYQRDAVKYLKDIIYSKLNSSNRNISNTVILKAPTGSGKTYIVSSLLEEFVSDYHDDNFCVIWACPGKGELHNQSYSAVKEYNGGNPICTLLEDEYFGAKKSINKHEIVFVNWEKLVEKNSETNEWSNVLMRDQEKYNFRDVLNNTRTNNTKIILIVDESHIGKDEVTRIQELIRDVIRPNVILEMSATPKSNPDYTIDPEDVIAEGMIKKDIIVNENIKNDYINLSEIDSQTLILENGYAKRLELLNEFKKLNVNVNPLTLIQIPNKDAGEEKKKAIIDFLREKGVTEENGKLKIWLSQSKDFDKKEITKNTDITEFLIFKTAVATGWDCPRAQILIKFREGKSETFEIQTVGRILRTPEAKHYDNELLDNAYIYTNNKKIEITSETYNPNRIKELQSNLRDEYTLEDLVKQTQLRSDYRSRQGLYNDATSEISKYYEDEFKKYFGLTDKDKYMYDYCEQVFKDKGLNLNVESNDQIIEETSIETKTIEENSSIETELIDIKSSLNDIKAKYYDLIKKNLNGLAYERSKTRINTAIMSTFKMFYSVFERDVESINYQNIVVNNENVFSFIINNATKQYVEDKINSQLSKTVIEKIYSFDIKKFYERDKYIDVGAVKSLYQPLYMLKNTNAAENRLESSFVAFLDTMDEVLWYFKNDSADTITNFGISYDEGKKTFRPDFIVKFSNGKVGIFDTKPINYNVEDTKQKAEALYEYVYKMNERDGDKPTIVGGIVVSEDYTNFYYYLEKEYFDFDHNRENWWPFKDVVIK